MVVVVEGRHVLHHVQRRGNCPEEYVKGGMSGSRMWCCVALITENTEFYCKKLSVTAPYLGPRSSHPDEAADVVDARSARSDVGGTRRGADGRRRDAVEPVDLVLDVADDRPDDEPRALALLPLADIPAATRRHTASSPIDPAIIYIPPSVRHLRALIISLNHRRTSPVCSAVNSFTTVTSVTAGSHPCPFSVAVTRSS